MSIITSFATNQRREPATAPAGGLTNADNGLSVAGDGVTAVLGEPVTNPQSGVSKLLDPRYIPMNNFPLLFGLTNNNDPSLNDNFIIDPALGVYLNYLQANGKYPYFALSCQDGTLPYMYWLRDPAPANDGFLIRWAPVVANPGYSFKFWDSGNVSIGLFPAPSDDGIGLLQVHGSITVYDVPQATTATKLLGADTTTNQLVEAVMKGQFSLPGNGITFKFTVPHNFTAATPTAIIAQAASAVSAAAGVSFIDNITSANFDITFSVAPTTTALFYFMATL